MTTGFYHPSKGVWFTTRVPTSEFLASYPEGTVSGVPHPPLVGEYTYDPHKNSWSEVEQVPPTPEEIRAAMPSLTARQFRLGLLAFSISPSEVEEKLNAIPDATEKAVAITEWEYATNFERLHPLVVDLSVSLGFSPEQIDSMWMHAETL